jgi:hypothetical protein
MLSEGDVCGCEPEKIRSSIGTARDEERREQDYGWMPCDEEKAEMRPVATHYRKAPIRSANANFDRALY